MSLFKTVGALIDKIGFGFWVAAGGLLLFTICSVVVDVVLRMLFSNVALPWVVEVNEYCLFGITFLASVWCLKVGSHVRVDFISSFFKPSSQNLLNTGSSALASLGCFIFAYYGGVATLFSYERGTHIFKFLKVPKYYFAFVISVCSLLLAIEFARQTYTYYHRWRSPDAPLKSEG
jgi:TRAP-type C4-dicarboxylate transport system permease small subunit